MHQCDYLIIGTGIIGLTIAAELRKRSKDAVIILIEKESSAAEHASGRNSGVIHSGFYYTADSLKARLSVAGAKKMKEFYRSRSLPINECGQMVVARNASEVEKLYELKARGDVNGVPTEILDAASARKIEPNLKTFDYALWSPREAVADPLDIARVLQKELLESGVQFLFSTSYLSHTDGGVLTSAGLIKAGKIINCAGVYADKIARDFGFAKRVTIIPFKGLYLKYQGDPSLVRTHVYPVPSSKNPFLGVHFTKTVSGGLKIGPTAIPAFWRENYEGISRFRFDELREILYYEAKLFITNRFHFRSLAFEEIQKYLRSQMVKLASQMISGLEWQKFNEWLRPGIRAQLIDIETLELIQDFAVEGDGTSIHVLNAVSPAWTGSLAFSEYVVDEWVERKA